jgi:hypothetical protein
MNNTDLDRTKFLLSKGKFEEFARLLDAPSRDLPRLKRLLTEPGVFDVTDCIGVRSCEMSYQRADSESGPINSLAF